MPRRRAPVRCSRPARAWTCKVHGSVSDSNGLPSGPNGYRIQNRLGSGRTAHVYLAQHDRHGRVALKMPRDEIATDPVLRRMFENEVMITTRLDHERVVRALEGKPTGPTAHLTLEMCAGGTLDQLLLEQGRLPLRKAVRLVEDVAEGLAYSHESKVLHRDVKPANVFLTADGRAKLGDFGTGAFLSDPSSERVGTAFYMAPELFEGKPASIASDIYSLGVLAFEVLTGERPFRGETYDALMHEHLSGLLRDPRAIRGNLPDGMARVVRGSMARTPERRPVSVAKFLADFRSASEDHRDREPTPKPKAGRSGRTAGSPGESKAPPEEDDAAESPEREGSAWWRRLFGGGGDRKS